MGVLFCIVMLLAYPAFRMEVTEELRYRKIRKRDIRQKQKGAMNFWFYTELERSYGLGMYGVLLRLYPIVAGIFIAVYIPFGWIESFAPIGLVVAAVAALYLSAIILTACVSRNRRLFGKPFIIWGWQRVKNDGSRRKFEVREDGTYLQHYSTLFDLILTVVPWIFPVMMGVF
jgi:hypothetical protein